MLELDGRVIQRCSQMDSEPRDVDLQAGSLPVVCFFLWCTCTTHVQLSPPISPLSKGLCFECSQFTCRICPRASLSFFQSACLGFSCTPRGTLHLLSTSCYKEPQYHGQLTSPEVVRFLCVSGLDWGSFISKRHQEEKKNGTKVSISFSDFRPS